MELVLENDGRHVILLTPALHEGGEGGIYGILGTSQVAKLFHAPSAEAARKLAVMVKNVPEIGNCDGRFSLAWPLSRLMQPGGKCVGYLMTRVEGKVPLYHFSNPRLRPEWVSRGFLIRVASNLAAAVSAVHRAGHVIGDLNDSNVLVGTDASVTIVDTDSFQVSDKRFYYPSPVARPEFTPPELHGVPLSRTKRTPHHDAFGLSVLVFQLLMDGNHPFAARYLGNEGKMTLEERIQNGIWPYSRGGSTAYVPRKTAPPFSVVPARVRALLRQCFEAGHREPTSRPTAETWEEALGECESTTQRARQRDAMTLRGLFRRGKRAVARTWGAFRRHRLRWLVVGSAAVLAVAAIFFFLW